LFIKDLNSDHSRYIPAIFDCQTDDESMGDASNRNKIIKQKLLHKVYLNTSGLKPNFQTLLQKFNMIVIGEIIKLDDIYCEDEEELLGVEEGETYTSITIRAISNLGYSKDNEFHILSFPESDGTQNI
jgi:hypothetical protein